ncbi:MAG: diadenylate cyclase [Gemmatimonadetes bacterium]|nr:diadenylate cyclase [Gemmatimonadota bacterium]
MAKSNKNHTQSLLSTAKNLARETCADMILLMANSGVTHADVHGLNATCQVLIVTGKKHFLQGVEEKGVQRLTYDYRRSDDTHFEQLRQCVIRGMESGHIRRDARLVCLSLMLASQGVDAITVLDTSIGFDIYDPAKISAISGNLPLKVVKTTLELAINIGKEGREGEPVGTLFVIGDSKRVLHHSRSMTFDPFRGYSDKEKNICNPDIHEGVKEVSLMDGAFIIREDGVILSGGRYISASVRGLTLPKELGARHVAAAAITKTTRAIALAISESTGTVRVFKQGKIVLQINTHRWHIGQDQR